MPIISPTYAVTMARYNRWQNRSLYTAADTLSEAARRLDRGAFFGSIQGTLSHLLWGDRQWMSRFAGTPKPEVPNQQSASLYPDWHDLERKRADFDELILGWARGLDERALASELVWFSGAAGKEMRRPLDGLVVHFFNHQTHHRGQVHAMLTAAGARPDDTDLMLMPLED